MTLEQMISDTREVTNYLTTRFKKDKIYLMGHSGGTFIGIHAAAKIPELYYEYIGVAQMSFQLKSEMLAHDYTVSYTIARDYFEKLKAPVKGFYTFEQSAHSPLFEEPAKMQRILPEDVIKGLNKLADKQ
jgi:alpha/beta superfamily hydrolase